MKWNAQAWFSFSSYVWICRWMGVFECSCQTLSWENSPRILYGNNLNSAATSTDRLCTVQQNQQHYGGHCWQKIVSLSVFFQALARVKCNQQIYARFVCLIIQMTKMAYFWMHDAFYCINFSLLSRLNIPPNPIKLQSLQCHLHGI